MAGDVFAVLDSATASRRVLGLRGNGLVLELKRRARSSSSFLLGLKWLRILFLVAVADSIGRCCCLLLGLKRVQELFLAVVASIGCWTELLFVRKEWLHSEVQW